MEWKAPSSDGGSTLLGYYIYYQELPAGPLTQSALITTEFGSLGALTADANHLLKVVAENSVGEGDFSPVIYQYSAAVPSSLTAPTVDQTTRTSSSLNV
mmetsp:Transcript_30249/g.29573  ORF Transcript_30249/g.29573 Transcript_30249/m.29573 type:complete len:99 (+) Transcript_30249:252-548(+)